MVIHLRLIATQISFFPFVAIQKYFLRPLHRKMTIEVSEAPQMLTCCWNLFRSAEIAASHVRSTSKWVAVIYVIVNIFLGMEINIWSPLPVLVAVRSCWGIHQSTVIFLSTFCEWKWKGCGYLHIHSIDWSKSSVYGDYLLGNRDGVESDQNSTALSWSE